MGTVHLVNSGFRREIRESGLTVAEEGLCSCDSQFDSLMYAVIRR